MIKSDEARTKSRTHLKTNYNWQAQLEISATYINSEDVDIFRQWEDISMAQ